MAKTPQISNAETFSRLSTSPLGRRPVGLTLDDLEYGIASDVAADRVTLGGQRFVITGSGRVRMA